MAYSLPSGVGELSFGSSPCCVVYAWSLSLCFSAIPSVQNVVWPIKTLWSNVYISPPLKVLPPIPKLAYRRPLEKGVYRPTSRISTSISKKRSSKRRAKSTQENSRFRRSVWHYWMSTHSNRCTLSFADQIMFWFSWVLVSWYLYSIPFANKGQRSVLWLRVFSVICHLSNTCWRLQV